MANVNPSAIDELLALGANPSIISFGGGYPDASLFPKQMLNQVFNEIINDPTGSTMQYAPSDGLPTLREKIATLMNEDGTPCAIDDILILQGSQQGIDLAARMLINPGDTLITEDPTFLGALLAFNPNQPNYAAIPMDENGMKMDVLEETLKSNPKSKLIYTIPDFQNPTGVTMSIERRKELINLANFYDVIILEDTPYRHIRFEGQKLTYAKITRY